MNRSIRLAVLCLGLCSSTTAAASPPSVFVSIAPQRFFVREIAGDLVRVEVLVPPGASPATYEPTPHQMAALQRADLFLQIGVPFESSLLKKIAELAPGLEIVDLRRGVSLEAMAESHGTGATGHPDPHIWLDPERVKTISGNVSEALVGVLPAQRPTFERNLAAFRNALDRTDSRIAAVLAPFAGRELLVYHPAFGYFCRRYDLRQTAIESEGKAPSARRLAELVDRWSGSAPAVIFAQPQFSASAARTAAAALGSKVVELDPLAEDYLTNLENMAERIATALGGRDE